MKRIEGEWRYFDEELGIPFPWYTKPALDIIKTWDLKRKRIFEYGSGDSTHWFRSKGAVVDGVDNNLSWADRARVRFEKYFPAYVDCIEYYKCVFDIIIIDGDWRDECTEVALKHLKPGGFLIIDNYKQASVPTDWSNTEKLIKGMTVGLHKEPEREDWVTAIVYKPNNTRLR